MYTLINNNNTYIVIPLSGKNEGNNMITESNIKYLENLTTKINDRCNVRQENYSERHLTQRSDGKITLSDTDASAVCWKITLSV